MKFFEALGAVIREERQRQGLTLRDISKAGYISMGHLSDVENGRKEGSSVFIESISKALGLEAYELVLEAGYLMAGQNIPDTYEDFIGESPLAPTAL